MKRLLLAGCLLASSLVSSRAQSLPALPNPGFETWTATPTHSYPNGWTTSDQLYAAGGLPLSLATVTQTSDKHSGASALKMQSQAFVTSFIPSLLVLGNLRNTNTNYPGGIACAARPAALQLWYKYQGTAVDSTQAAIVLTRGGGTNRQEIGGGGQLFQPGAASSGYRLAQIPIAYSPLSIQPDSLYLVFVNNAASATGAFYLDDVVLTNTVTAAAEPMLAGALVAYPNPSADGRFKVRAEQDFDLVAGTLTVTDATGRTVLREAACPTASVTAGRTVDLRGQRAGMYMLRLEAPRGTVVRRLLVN